MSADVALTSRKRKVIQNVVILICFLALALFWFRWLERRMVFYPDRVNYGSPADFGLACEDVWLTTADCVRVHGWFLPHGNKTACTCLLLHGNAGNLTARLDKLQILRDAGLSVLIIDYRGYGRSEGHVSEVGTYRDADAAYAWLAKEKGIEPRRIILYGESLGCGPAVDLAARKKVGGVILEAGFTSVPDKAAEIYPFLPVRWLLKTKYDNLSKIRRVTAPVLLFHSREDEIFPFRHAERLYEVANLPKELVELRGDHNGAFLESGHTYAQKIKEFAASCASAGSR